MVSCRKPAHERIVKLKLMVCLLYLDLLAEFISVTIQVTELLVVNQKCITGKRHTAFITVFLICAAGSLLNSNMTSHLIPYSAILLLLSGDIETNPGPDKETENILSVYHINVWSLRNKMDLVTSHCDKYEVVAITETKLDQTIPDQKVKIHGFHTIFRKDLTIDSGGVCLQLSGNVVGERLYQFEEDDLELLWAKIKTSSKTFIIGTLYKNPRLPRPAFWARIQDNITTLTEVHGLTNLIILGDFNEDLLNPDYYHLKDLINSFSMEQLITEPTRITSHSRTLLDPILCGPGTNIQSSGVLTPFCSDHSPVFVKLFLGHHVTRKQSTKRKVWLFNRADWELYRNELRRIDWENIFDSNDINKLVQSITDSILMCAKKAIPTKTIRENSRDKPWMTGEIKYEMKQRNTLYNHAKRSGLANDFIIFKTQRNKVINLIRNAKHVFRQNQANRLANDNSTEKSWWNVAKSILNPDGDNRAIPPLQHNGKVISDDKEKAEIFNEYFSSISTVDETNLNLPHITIPDNQLQTLTFSETDVKDQIKLLNIHKAYGPDNISPRFIKEGCAVLSAQIYRLLKILAKEKCYPQLWKVPNVVPIYKKDDPHIVSNYRPISLLCVIGKIFEKIIFKDIYNHVREMITPAQSGFLPQHSTTTQMLEIYHNIMQGLDEKKEVCITFCDISKAFDKVSHKALIHKLQTFGITGDLLELLKSYLTDRQQSVIIAGNISSLKPVEAGVPQGSNLGPLLFLVSNNDSVDPEVMETETRLFADDTSSYLISPYLDLEINMLQNDMNSLFRWSEKWLVKFNPAKTECMLISRKQNETKFDLMFNNVPVKQVETHKHLGLTLDCKGTWLHHIDEVVQKATKRIGILRNIQFIADRKTLGIIYKTYIRSILEYGDVIWDGLPQYAAERLEKVQLEGLKIITGLTKSASRNTLYTESGIEPLYQRRRKHRLIMFYKIVNGYAPEYLRALLPPRVHERNNYPTRNMNDFSLYFTRTAAMATTFFPQTTKDWNSLPEIIKNAESVGIFKRLLAAQNDLPTVPIWYLTGNRRANIYHCRLRNSCSSINHHLFNNYVSDSPTCTRCNTNSTENVDHYLLRCNKYNEQRDALLRKLNTLEIDHITPSLLLEGSMNFSIEENIDIMKSVQDFILKSKRFD